MSGRGRGIAEMIRHLTHLTPIGWCYMGGAIIVSLATWQASKRVIPRLIRHQARKYYPDFEWIVIPHGFPISGLLFLCLCFPLGYFCESNDDDIFFFQFMSGIFFVFAIIPVLYNLFNQKCFMRNNQALFISSFALLGFYKRISIEKDSIKTYMGGSNKEDQIIEFTYPDGKKVKINTANYSDDGRKIIFDVFDVEELTA